MKILYVEDEVELRENIAIMLRRRSKNVTLAESGERALIHFRENPAQIVITDISMPGMSGIEMARDILQIDPNVKIIFTTAFTDMEFFQAAIDIGVSDYILKPLERDRIYRALDKCIREFSFLHEKQEMEKAIQESERKYRDLFENAPVAYFSIDQTGKITNANNESGKLLFLPQEELIQKSFIDFCTLENSSKEKFYYLYNSVINLQVSQKEELSLRRLDHETIWVHIFARPILSHDDGITQIHLSAVNITDKKIYQESILQSEQRYRLLTENMIDIIMQTDTRGFIQFVTPSFEIHLGYRIQDILGKSMFTHLHPDDLVTAKEIVQEAISAAKSCSLEYRIRTSLGNYIWMQTVGNPILSSESSSVKGIVFSVRNISDQKSSYLLVQNNLHFLQQLIDVIPAPIFYKDTRGKYLGCNRSFEAYIGKVKSEIIGRSVYEIAPIELADQYQQNDQALLLKQGIQSYSAKVSGADQQEYEFHFYKTTFTDIHGELGGIVGVMLDITELSQTKRLLEEKTYILNEAERMARIGSWQRDLITGHDIWSDQLFRILGLSPGSIIPTFSKVSTFIHMEDKPILDSILADISSGHFQDFYQFRIVVQNHSIIHIKAVLKLEKDQNLKPTRIIGTIQDITQSLEDKQRLVESETKFKAIGEAAKDAIVLVNQHIKISFWNPAAEAMFGYSAAEMMNKDPHIILAPEEYHKKIQENMANFIRDGSGSFLGRTNEMMAIRKDGTQFPIEISLASEKILGSWHAIGIIRDISNRKKTENGLIEAKERAEALTKAKNQFLMNMSHEMKTPLNGILGLTRLLLHTSLNDIQNEYLTNIQLSADHLLNSVNNILDLARLESGQIEFKEKSFNLKQELELLILEVNPLLKIKDLILTFTWEENLAELYIGCPEKLMQVVHQILGNAIKFTEKGGISLNVSQKIPEGLTKGAKKQIGKIPILITVKDSGIGIRQENLYRIFSEFTQEDDSNTRSFGGAGVGLTISQKIIEKFDGNISVDSNPGAGSTFFILVPLTPYDNAEKQSELEPQKKSEDLHPQQFPPLKILVADDHPINQKIAKGFFQHLGYDIKLANNGQEVLAELLKNRYDIIFLDISMPVLDGLEAARIIRTDAAYQLHKNTPLVALTAFPIEDNRDSFLRSGLDFFLSKPIRLEDILALLRQVIELGKSKKGD